MIAVLQIVPIANLLLGRFPLQRRLKPRGLVYRVTSLDQFSIATGLLVRDEYGPVLDGRPIETLIDLGCNAGWFTLWLDARTQNPQLKGLLVDANPRMVAEATWHMQQNRLADCIVVHGAVGLPADQSSTTFHIHPSSSASSVLLYEPRKQLPVKGKIVDVAVPAVSVATEWQSHFGSAAVDLMKIDIEGMELDLVVKEGAFLERRVKRLVIEWHKWCVSLAQLESHLKSIGFEQCKSFGESELVGLALFKNTNEVA
jgi:FkbM family methyltransferase